MEHSYYRTAYVMCDSETLIDFFVFFGQKLYVTINGSKLNQNIFWLKKNQVLGIHSMSNNIDKM